MVYAIRCEIAAQVDFFRSVMHEKCLFCVRTVTVKLCVVTLGRWLMSVCHCVALKQTLSAVSLKCFVAFSSVWVPWKETVLKLAAKKATIKLGFVSLS